MSERWVCDLFAQLTNVLIVIMGRDELTWGEIDGDWRDPSCLEQHLLGGLSAHDSEAFLALCGIDQGELRSAVLAACIDIKTTHQAHGQKAYHPYSLSLCAYTIANERREGKEPDPATFGMAPGDYDQLAARFLKSLPHDSDIDWIVRLAQTPRFDEAAAREAYSQQEGQTSGSHINAAWDSLMDYSFVTPLGQPGWWTLHAQMAESLRKRLADTLEKAIKEHTWWRSYWQRRSQDSTDEFASLAWYHRYRLEPELANREWNRLAEQMRTGASPRMAIHARLLDWWTQTGIEQQKPADAFTASALNDLGVELWKASLGIRAANINRAIACHEAALRVRTEDQFPQDWAMTQNNLGAAYSDLPAGDRGENLQKAIACYAAALRVYTEDQFPQDWAMTQNNLGILLEEMGRFEEAREAWVAAARGYHTVGFEAEVRKLEKWIAALPTNG